MSSDTAPVPAPFGLQYRRALKMDEAVVASSLSADGRTIAMAFSDKTVRLWDLETASVQPHQWILHAPATALAISPDGKTVAIADGKVLRCWSPEGATRERAHFQLSERGAVTALSWSPDGLKLASVSANETVELWDVRSQVLLYTLSGLQTDYSVTRRGDEAAIAPTWSLDGREHFIALRAGAILRIDSSLAVFEIPTETENVIYAKQKVSIEKNGVIDQIECAYLSNNDSVLGLCCTDRRHSLASANTGGTVRILGIDGSVGSTFEGHTGSVTFIAPCGRGRLLVTGSDDRTIRVWRVKDGAAVAVLNHKCREARIIGVQKRNLAYLDPTTNTVHVWSIDEEALEGAAISDSIRYRNAKVVLVGDTGTGKSGLGLVLTGQDWKETGSTHGRNVWTFKTEDVKLPGGLREKRETLLWDLAGQPGCRLVHQLHLHEVGVALVVFDAHSDVDPLAGVRYWDRAGTGASSGPEKSASPA